MSRNLILVTNWKEFNSNDFHSEYKSLRETLEDYDKSPEDNKETLKNSKWTSSDLNQWEEADKTFTKNLEKIDKGLDQITKAKVT